MKSHQKIITECVDYALSKVDFVNKKEFYHQLQISKGIKQTEIGVYFDRFHAFMSAQLGVKHYQVERLIIRIMHQRTEQGIYHKNDELTAFSLVTDTFLRESEANTQRIKKLVLENKDDKEKIVKQVDDRIKTSERMIAIGETAAMVGHDIRNPLQAITGDLYLLSEELKEVPEGENKLTMQESIKSIQENLEYINKIVSDLQDFTRPLTPEWKKVDVSDFLNQLLYTISIPDKFKIELELDNSLQATTDPMFLRRALTNLVTNAIQAMPNGGSIQITAHAVADRLILTVQDNGEGIPEEVKERMFKPLVTTKSKGQGLGLAVVKRLIDALNGTVNFDSEKGKGTKFIITLPLAQK